MTVSGKSMDILNSKLEERTEAMMKVFSGNWLFHVNNIFFEIKLSDYKQQQSYPMNEQIPGPINISNKSNMISQNR